MMRRAAGAAKRQLAVGMVVATAVVAILAGCGSSTTTTPTLKLVTYEAFALPSGVEAAVTKATGARLRLVQNGDAGSMLSAAILHAGRPSGDVIYGIDNSLLTRALNADLLAPLDQKTLDAVPAKYAGLGGNRLVPVAVGQVCVLYDKKWFAAHKVTPPQSLQDLTAARLKNLLVIENPVTSSPGMVLLAGSVKHFGAQWPQWWRALKANGTKVVQDWSAAYEVSYSVSGGDRPIVLSYGSSPPAEVVYGESPEPSSVVVPSTCVEQIEFAGVLKGAADPRRAQDLVRAIQGSVFQRGNPLANFVYPISETTPLPPVFRRFAVRVPDPLQIPNPTSTADRDRWIEQWRGIFG